MSIRRGPIPAVDHFTIVPNDWARDPRLTDGAVGLLVRLLSHREGWEVAGVRDLARRSASGREAITSAVLELERYGYLKREHSRSADGRFGSTDYLLTGTPVPPDGPQPPPIERSRRRAAATEPSEVPLPGIPVTGTEPTGARDTGARHTGARDPGARDPGHKEDHSEGDHCQKNPPTPPQAGGPCARHPSGAPQGVSCRACGTDRASRERQARLAASAAASAAAAARAAGRTGLGAERDPDASTRGAAAARAAFRWGRPS